MKHPKIKACGRCIYYDRVGVDYGECRINPSYSYISCRATCEDFVYKVTKAKNINKLVNKD